MKESYLFLAQGFEEVEALTAVDVLRRAGIPVKTVSITDSLQVTGANGITVTADVLFADSNFDNALWLICPGGMPGSVNLHEYEPLQKLLVKQATEKRGIAAICAAPALVLAPLNIVEQTLGSNQARDIAAGLLFFPAKENDIDFTFG